MMFLGKSVFNTSFDTYADAYHSVRPGYPSELFDNIKKQCGITERSRLLEIGAGSGIATAELAKFGAYITALEPGVHLVDIARSHVKEYKNAHIFEGTFEDFQTNETFDVLLAFTAFHWLKEDDRYQKIFDLLDESGSLVLVWNSFFQSDAPATHEVNKAYHEFLPEVYPEVSQVTSVNKGVFSKLNSREQEVVQNSQFSTVFLEKHLTVYQYNEKTYPQLLNTFPKIVEVEKGRREAFFGKISEIVKQHGGISVPILSTLIILKKRQNFLEMIATTEMGVK